MGIHKNLSGAIENLQRAKVGARATICYPCPRVLDLCWSYSLHNQ